MARRRSLSAADRIAWAKVAATVTPRAGRAPPDTDTSHEREAAQTKPARKNTPKRSAGHKDAGQHLAHPRSPADRSGEKRVRRGKIDIDGRIDLHGMTLVQAHHALRGFIRAAAQRRARCVLVITGKGAPDHAERFLPMGERAPGVIRRATPGWLSEPDIAPLLAGTAPAHASHGGSGALYVFLKARKG